MECESLIPFESTVILCGHFFQVAINNNLLQTLFHKQQISSVYKAVPISSDIAGNIVALEQAEEH